MYLQKSKGTNCVAIKFKNLVRVCNLLVLVQLNRSVNLIWVLMDLAHTACGLAMKCRYLFCLKLYIDLLEAKFGFIKRCIWICQNLWNFQRLNIDWRIPRPKQSVFPYLQFQFWSPYTWMSINMNKLCFKFQTHFF